MKKTIIALVIIAVLGVAAYALATRAPSAPSQDINQANGEATSSAASGTYTVSQSESSARFEIHEILRGSGFTAVGTTSQVAGTVAVGTSSISVGAIRINARTFKTDSPQRDGAIARLILKSEDPANEFIVFQPKVVENNHALTATPSSYTVSGDLTISGVTKPALFTVQAALVNGSVIATASATVKRSAFNLVIPNIPFVASVDDEFKVSASIVAR